MVAVVSVMPFASFAAVLAVQGATTSRSSRFLGPSGSACAMLRIAGLPQISSNSATRSAAVPKRVSMAAACSEKIGVSSAPAFRSSFACANAAEKVQNEPVTTKPIRSPVRSFMGNAPLLENIANGVCDDLSRGHGCNFPRNGGAALSPAILHEKPHTLYGRGYHDRDLRTTIRGTSGFHFHCNAGGALPPHLPAVGASAGLHRPRLLRHQHPPTGIAADAGGGGTGTDRKRLCL